MPPGKKKPLVELPFTAHAQLSDAYRGIIPSDRLCLQPGSQYSTPVRRAPVFRSRGIASTMRDTFYPPPRPSPSRGEGNKGEIPPHHGHSGPRIARIIRAASRKGPGSCVRM